LSADSPLDRQPDSALVARYVAVRDEDAFRELVRRHGAMVLSTCARMLKHRQDAEDAFQAVFIILAARSRALRRVRSLGGWLHNVAVRVSYGVLRGNRRRTRRLFVTHRERPRPEERDRVRELQDVLDEELTALPAKYREAVVLCDLEGHTREEAARILNISAGTVATWLARGRRRLRDRLVRRGVTVGAGGLAAAAAQWAVGAPQITADLVQQTLRHAELFLLTGAKVSGTTAAAKITSLAQGELHNMFLTKLSTTVGIVALAVALVLGASSVSSFVAGLPSYLHAAQFFDDFNDGSATDGAPVNWLPFAELSNGTYSVEQESFILRPNAASRPLVSIADGITAKDVSIRTQVRVDGGSVGTAVFARFVGGSHTYQGGVETNGRVYIGWNDGTTRFHYLGQIFSDLRPDEEDVVLQFDVFGELLKLFAWRPTEPKPTVPTVSVIDKQFPDAGNIALLHHPIGISSGAFRYVHVAATPIPEPATAGLGSLGAIALASFVVRARLARVG
jgi:RNA polymerase sigma factor (sigma-70 family)